MTICETCGERDITRPCDQCQRATCAHCTFDESTCFGCHRAGREIALLLSGATVGGERMPEVGG